MGYNSKRKNNEKQSKDIEQINLLTQEKTKWGNWYSSKLKKYGFKFCYCHHSYRSALILENDKIDDPVGLWVDDI